MGAWKVMSRRMPGRAARGRRAHLHRPPGPGQPGEGYSGAHALEQERIVLTALTPGA